MDIPAVFPTHDDALEAAEELRAEGLADQQLIDGLHGPADHVLEVDVDRDVFKGIWVGGVLGAVVGSAIGVALLLLAQTFAGTEVTEMGALAAGVYGVAGFGFFFGTVGGIGMKMKTLNEQQRWDSVPLGRGETLVVVRDHGDEQHVREILRAHGGKTPHTQAA